jgi:hypothetical protein
MRPSRSTPGGTCQELHIEKQHQKKCILAGVPFPKFASAQAVDA